MRFTKRFFRNTNPPGRWKFTTVVSAVVLALVIMSAPTYGASDNTNLIQQILVLVQNIQTILVGTDVSVSSLQGDVSAIKAKTDNLPSDMATTLTEIRGAVGGYGPLNRTLMHSFRLADGGKASTRVACTSPGPFLLHVQGEGYNANIDVSLNGAVPFHNNYLKPDDRSYMVVGGDPGDVITVRAATPDAYYTFVNVLITMEYVDGQIASCNPAGT
jgi:hypothetical protein